MRMFPDYAGTVLWFGNPIRYEDSGLAQDLIRALRSWEDSYYQSLTPDIDWVSAEAAHRFTAEGNRLARQVADELGEGFEISFASYEEGVPARLFHSSGAAPNANAVAAFNALANAPQAGGQASYLAREEMEQSGGSGWYAYAPLADTSFGPPETGKE